MNNFSATLLPKINKTVFRMGIAGNYGINSSDIEWAADQGANYWLWGASFNKVTDGIRQVIKKDRDSHVVAMLGWGMFGWQIRRSVENALRKLETDYLDVFKLGWLGRTSRYSKGTIDTLVQLRNEGKIKTIGTSIHDRQRAGSLVLDSAIDVFMIRYNAKHPGAEGDIFPYLQQRNPVIVSYTALAWGQLLKPLQGVDIGPWPGMNKANMPPLTPELCYRFVLSNQNVHLVLTGPKNRNQLQQNMQAVHQGKLSQAEIEWIRQYGQIVRNKRVFDYIK